MAKKPLQLPPVTQGPQNAVPCCHCGKPNNFAGHAEMLENGNVFKCDHCGNPMQVCRVQTVRFVAVRKPIGQFDRIQHKR